MPELCSNRITTGSYRWIMVQEKPILRYASPMSLSDRNSLHAMSHFKPGDGPRFPPLEPKWRWMENVSIVMTWIDDRIKGPRRAHLQNEDLMYSLRAIDISMPWHNGELIIVSPGGYVPAWVNTAHPRLRIVPQETLLPGSVSVTRNTNCIEAHLYRLPNLTDVFLHFNDDYFIYAAYLHPSFYVNEAGLPRVYQDDEACFKRCDASFTNACCQWLTATRNPIRLAGLHTAKHLDAKFGSRLRYYTKHAPYVYHKRTLQALREEVYPQQYDETCLHYRRHARDILTPLMHSQYLMETSELKGRALYEQGSSEVAPNDILLRRQTGESSENKAFHTRVLRDGPLFFTLNANLPAQEDVADKDSFLSSIFPAKSSFEK